MVGSLPRVLIIAGSDSSVGAGAQRDLRVLAERGAAARCAITAVTAQSDRRVAAVQHVSPELIAAQIECALAEGVDAVKIGMLGTGESVSAVADALRAVSVPIVIDPVLLSSSGSALLDLQGRAALLQELCPRAALLTPNLPEARTLLAQLEGRAIEDDQVHGDSSDSTQALARALVRGTSCPVLLKGGHADGPMAVDWLCEDGELHALEAPRLRAQMRGTGCALSTAIALELAKGSELVAACRIGKDYVAELLRS